MKLVLTFYANMTSFDLDLIPGKGSLYIAYKTADRSYPDSHNIFPSNISEVVRKGPRVWDMTVRVHALKYKGLLSIEAVKKKENRKKCFSIYWKSK